MKALAVSPDGRKIVYATTEGLFLRSMSEMDARLIEGSDKASFSPFFSPDGKWIAYFSDADNKLKKIAVSGGTPIELCNVGYFAGGHWGANNMIVFGSYVKGIMQVSAKGGDPEVLIERDDDYFCYPQILPGGESLLFTLGGKQKIVVQSLESKERNELDTGLGAQYLATGHIIYALENSLFAVSFDLDTLEVTDGPTSLVEDVLMMGEVPQYATSQSGLLAYIPGSVSAEARLEWYDRQGNHIASVGEPAAYGQISLSHDEKRAIVELPSAAGYDLWVVELDREGIRFPVTFDAANETDPIWSPDGQSIVFSSSKSGLDDIYLKSLVREEEAELLYHSEKRLIAEDWSDDGRYIAYILDANVEGEGGGGIMLLPMSEKQDPISIVQNQFIYDEPEFSPNGKWIAYICDQSGIYQVYIRPLEGEGEEKLISDKGGGQPQWRGDGRELFYLAYDGAIMAVELKGESLTPGVPKTLFQTNLTVTPEIDQYAVTRNGESFLIVNPLKTGKTSSIGVVLNWFQELIEKLPVD
jgi:Tol biopolymer transport system component